MKPVIKIENLSKMYRLGTIGTGTISHDLNRWWHRVRGKEDPYLKIGEDNVSGDKSNSGYVWALKDINLEVMPGEVLGIIGKNGAGKSTLLKILSRVTGPTAGSISYTGRIGSLLEVGTGFHPELTGRENIFLNGAILGMTKAEIGRKLDEIVDFAGVERYIDTPVKRYSSGMRVRLGFAVAAFLEPDILVVDEVLAVGDAEFQKKAIGKMQDVSIQDGRTILFVSHNMNSIRSLCTKSILLNDGKITSKGDVDSIIKKYLGLDNKLTSDLLALNEGRFGSSEIRFTHIQFADKKGNKIDQVISGDFIEIQIGYKLNQILNPDELILSVLFRDYLGSNVLNFVTDEMNTKFNKLTDNGTFILRIPKLLLRGSTYYLRIRLNKNSNTSYKYVVDQVEKAAELRVIEGDIWKTGKSNRPGSMALLEAEAFNR